jgi:hypothetical protein
LASEVFRIGSPSAVLVNEIVARPVLACKVCRNSFYNFHDYFEIVVILQAPRQWLWDEALVYVGASRSIIFFYVRDLFTRDSQAVTCYSLLTIADR